MLRKGEGKEEEGEGGREPWVRRRNINITAFSSPLFPQGFSSVFCLAEQFLSTPFFLLPLQADACAERHSNQERGHGGDGTTFFTLSHRRGPTGANNLENQRKIYHCSLSGWAKLDPVYFLDLLMFVPLPPFSRESIWNSISSSSPSCARVKVSSLSSKLEVGGELWPDFLDGGTAVPPPLQPPGSAQLYTVEFDEIPQSR